ncbi:hypothetical protein KR093_007662 [Drosophila rubida]|uniref:Mitochondrial import inner membrane translocase subunit n=1 Tax=Drosophila rubida TaxID=30044 RepID=A0AAD4KAY5_9MUSC|nr:hypothetical protein KR093_007662 [Drosophila rubida]
MEADDGNDGSSNGETVLLMRQLKHQIAMANAQELLADITCKCFEKCVAKPRDHLSGTEQSCINLCMDRFLDSYRLCAHTYGHRLRREATHSRQA